MVQRYELSTRWEEPEMAKWDYGDYVAYDDYAALEHKLRNFAEQVMYEPCSKATEEMARGILGI